MKQLTRYLYPKFTNSSCVSISEQTNDKKEKQPNQKREEDLSRHFSKQDIQMLKRHLKRCSPSLIIREMQIKSKMRYHFTTVRISVIKKSTNNKCQRECAVKGTLLHCKWDCKLVYPLWRTVQRFPKKLKIELPSDPAIPLLCMFPEKNMALNIMCTPMFTVPLFTIAKTQKQLNVH